MTAAAGRRVILGGAEEQLVEHRKRSDPAGVELPVFSFM